MYEVKVVINLKKMCVVLSATSVSIFYQYKLKSLENARHLTWSESYDNFPNPNVAFRCPTWYPWSLVSKVSTNHLLQDPEHGSSLTERRGQEQGNTHYRRSCCDN